MPYIEVNKLKNDVINSWDNDKHRTAEASRVHGQEHSHLMLIVERQPTVDVVPRAELEQLQLKYDLAVAEREANVKGFTEDLAKAKTDTAREIFAEIEKKIKQDNDTFERCASRLVTVDYANGKNEEKELIVNFIAEIKKKYTEGEQ